MTSHAGTVQIAGMHPKRRSLLWLNVIGGIAVLGSYVHGIVTHPLTRGDAWGGVPVALQPLYTANMLFAAAGYFAFSYFVFFRLDPDRARIGERFGFQIFHRLYALILIPAALWMPLTFAMLDSPGTGLWLAVRGVLMLTGLGSLGLLAAIAMVQPCQGEGSRRLALLGCLFFCLQTAVLDALVWPAYFPF
jgi:hypothetical protein